MGEMLERLQNEQDLHRRSLLLVGYLTEQLKAVGVRPIVVGGQAVELYTFQDYTTLDVDLVSSHSHLAGNILESLGFTRMPGARHWIHDKLAIAVEIPDDQLAGDLDLLLEIEIEEFSFFVIGAEDLIVDRLNAYVHWKSTSDYEQALKIYLNHHEHINEAYLTKRAKEDLVEEGLKRLFSDFSRFLKEDVRDI